jgi:high-affinity Fe2+/Pb2+ permease
LSSNNGPSNFVIVALLVVAIVLGWFCWGTFHHHWSADQKILIEKSNQ